MWEWNDYANLSDDELKHYGVLGMRWGVINSRRNFYKSGQNYAKFVKNKDKAKRIMDKGFKQSYKGHLDEKTKIYTHTINTKKLDKYVKRADMYEKRAKTYLDKTNIYNKKAVSVMNKHNIDAGKVKVYKYFDAGLIKGFNPYGGIIGDTITAVNLQKRGLLHE